MLKQNRIWQLRLKINIITMTTDGSFNFFFNGESKTRKEIEQLIDYNTTVSIKGLDVFYSSPKVTTFKVETSSEDRNMIRTIQEIFKEIEEHQKQNGGILKGAEFPFDLYNKSEDEEFEDYIREQNIISDWERKEENSSPFTYNFDDIKLPKEEGGKKETEGKLNYELDWEFIQQMAERMGQNKDKYAPYNWQLDMDVESLKQSLFRHIIEVMKGNYSDNDRNYGHLESIALNALFINYQLKNNKLGYIK